MQISNLFVKDVKVIVKHGQQTQEKCEQSENFVMYKRNPIKLLADFFSRNFVGQKKVA